MNEHSIQEAHALKLHHSPTLLSAICSAPQNKNIYEPKDGQSSVIGYVNYF